MCKGVVGWMNGGGLDGFRVMAKMVVGGVRGEGKRVRDGRIGNENRERRRLEDGEVRMIRKRI